MTASDHLKHRLATGSLGGDQIPEDLKALARNCAEQMQVDLPPEMSGIPAETVYSLIERIAQLEGRLRDEALAFNHANETVAKYEAENIRLGQDLYDTGAALADKLIEIDQLEDCIVESKKQVADTTEALEAIENAPGRCQVCNAWPHDSNCIVRVALAQAQKDAEFWKEAKHDADRYSAVIVSERDEAQAALAQKTRECEELQKAFNSFACEMFAVAITGLADAAIVAHQPMTEEHTRKAVNQVAETCKSLRVQVEQLGRQVAEMSKPVTDESVNAIVTSLYRRFKEWSKRGFGPEDVTWCEVKADVLALCAAQRGSRR